MPLYHLQLHSHAELRADGDDLLIAKPSGEALRAQRPDGVIRALLDRLTEMGGETGDLIAAAQAADPGADMARLYYTLARLEQRGLLAFRLHQDGQVLATLEPMTGAFQHARLDLEAPGYRLSRFAWLRRDEDALVLECARGACRLRLHDARMAALIGALASTQTLDQLCQQLPSLSRASLTGALALLASAQALFPCSREGQLPEDDDPALRLWDYHDLLFHTRSRSGRHDNPLGATFHLMDELPHSPAIKPAGAGARVPLPRPCATAPEPGFFSVLEQRRSIRDFGDEPITLTQLGELFWFVARVKTHQPANPDNPRQYEATHRPVAGGGAMHELELYLTVSQCLGLDAGLYRYDPQAHELEWIRAPNADTQGLIADAMRAAAFSQAPDVLITLAARFGRMSWKYQGIAYALVLKHVGVWYQQLYLVATALGLAPRALGAGNSDRFAAAAGTRYEEETSVGEFALSGSIAKSQAS